MAGAYFSGFPHEVYHFLVITVHEVYFKSFNPHGCIMFHYFFHISVESPVACPQDKVYVFAFGIGCQFRQVDLRDNLQHICLFVHCPSFVKNYIFNFVLGGKINIIFVGIIVDSCAEIHA